MTILGIYCYYMHMYETVIYDLVAGSTYSY